MFLGHEISLNRIKLSVDRAQGILNFEKTKNEKEFAVIFGYDNI
jgi:hypothetical protein